MTSSATSKTSHAVDIHLAVDIAGSIAQVGSRRRAATVAGVSDILAMADAVIALDGLVRDAVAWIGERDAMFRAGLDGDDTGESTHDDEQSRLYDELILRLAEHNYLTIEEDH